MSQQSHLLRHCDSEVSVFELSTAFIGWALPHRCRRESIVTEKCFRAFMCIRERRDMKDGFRAAVADDF